MSAYLPPTQFLPIYNEAEYLQMSNSLTITSADSRYLKLTGGTETGLVNFSAGLNSSTMITGSNNAGQDSLAISYTNNLSSWTLNSQAALNSNVWTSACWSSELGLFVAVANSGNSRVAYSSNGTTWTGIAPGGTPGAGLDTRTWTSIIWAKELSLFVACASSGASIIMTSPNGTTWTGQSADNTSTWNCVCWSPELGLLVAVALSGTNRIMTSPNGITWTIRTPANGNSWDCVAWSPELGIFAGASSSTASFKAMYSTNGISWTQTTSADELFNNGARWNEIIWCPELSQFICCANGSVYGVNNDPALMTSSDGINWGNAGGSSTTPLYKNYLSICWAPEIGQVIVMANDASPITTYNNVSGWTSRTSASIASLSWNACAWSKELGISVGLSGSGASRGSYSINSNSINIKRNGNVLTQNGMLANIEPTITASRIKSNNTIYSKKLTSNSITSYGSNLFNNTYIGGGGQLLADSTNRFVNPWLLPKYSFDGFTNTGLYFSSDDSTYKTVGVSVGGNYITYTGINLSASNAAYWNINNSNGTYMGGFNSTSGSSTGYFDVQGYLNVNGGINQTYTYGYLNSSGSTGTGSSTHSYSIICANHVKATEFNAVSSKKIKTIQASLDDSATMTEAINLFKSIPLSKYVYTDLQKNDSYTHYGLIAEDMPNGIYTDDSQTGYIPSIYSIGIIDSIDLLGIGSITLNNAITSDKMSQMTNMQYLLCYKSEDEGKTYSVFEVMENLTIIDDTHLTVYLPDFQEYDRTGKTIFVYGTQESIPNITKNNAFEVSMCVIKNLLKRVEDLELKTINL